MRLMPLYVDLDETLGFAVQGPNGEIVSFIVRPWAREFLKALSHHGPVYIFTMGTRDYAEYALSRIGAYDSLSGVIGREDLLAHEAPHGGCIKKFLAPGVLFDDLAHRTVGVQRKQEAMGMPKRADFHIQVSSFSVMTRNDNGLQIAYAEFLRRIA